LNSEVNIGSKELVSDKPASSEAESANSPTTSGFLDRASTWWIGLVLMLTTLLVPVLLTPVPPLTDYPNHLARCYLLAFGKSDPILREMFTVNWRIIPNIAIDLVLPRMMLIFGPFAAGRLLLVCCLLLTATGTIALSFAYFKRRTFWQLAAGFAAFNTLFLMGFMNFQIALGIAMWAAAAWIMYRESHPVASMAVASLFTPIIFFFHLFGLCFYVLLVGSYELSVFLDRHAQKTLDVSYIAKRISMFAVALIVPVFLYGSSPLERVDIPPQWHRPLQKLYMVLDSVVGYSIPFDLFLISALLTFLIFCVINGHARISKAALIGATTLICIYAVAPWAYKGVHFVDARLPVMIGFLFFAGFIPRLVDSRQRYLAVAFFALLFIARTAITTAVWHDSQRDLADLRQIIEPVTPGSRVLVADVTPIDNPEWNKIMPTSRRIPNVSGTYWHLASFILLDRHAFWPNIFAQEYQQPISISEPYREVLAIRASPIDYAELTQSHWSDSILSHFPFLPHWQDKFDFVLLLNAEGLPDLDRFVPDKLELINHQGIAALFRIRK
jgi:hypothetical protein